MQLRPPMDESTTPVPSPFNSSVWPDLQTPQFHQTPRSNRSGLPNNAGLENNALRRGVRISCFHFLRPDCIDWLIPEPKCFQHLSSAQLNELNDPGPLLVIAGAGSKSAFHAGLFQLDDQAGWSKGRIALHCPSRFMRTCCGTAQRRLKARR